MMLMFMCSEGVPCFWISHISFRRWLQTLWWWLEVKRMWLCCMWLVPKVQVLLVVTVQRWIRTLSSLLPWKTWLQMLYPLLRPTMLRSRMTQKGLMLGASGLIYVSRLIDALDMSMWSSYVTSIGALEGTEARRDATHWNSSILLLVWSQK